MCVTLWLSTQLATVVNKKEVLTSAYSKRTLLLLSLLSEALGLLYE
jgi:hypothetical protein